MHHRHTSYPVLIALILIVGVLVGLTGRIARADDLLVTATVPAPIPTGAPAFTSPTDGSTTSDPTVAFGGTCPVITPAVIIALYEGTTLLGSGICESDGTFHITASLAPGSHAIIATVVTITNDTGQSSAPLHITYAPPSQPLTPTTPTTSATPAGPSASHHPIPEAGTVAPLEIVSDPPFITFDAKLSTTWRVSFRGGVIPYTVIVAWGDGHIDNYPIDSPDFQALTHTYTHNRLYTVTVTMRDQSGLSLTRYYVAMRTNGAPASQTGTSFATLIDSPLVNQFWAAWIIYLCLLLMMLLMWRHEHTYYPRGLIGLPLHYRWQKSRTPHRAKPHH